MGNRKSQQQSEYSQKNASQEEIYLTLNITIKRVLSVISWLIWPVGLAFTITAAYFGLQIHNLRDQIAEKQNEVNNIVYNIQDERININKTQEELKSEQRVLREKIEQQVFEIDTLSQRTKTVTDEGDKLLTDIQIETNDLVAKAKLQISEQNRFLEKNKTKIEEALVGIKEKEKLLEALKQDQDKELEKIRNITALFVNLQVYELKGRNTIPNPYIDKQLEILDIIADLSFTDLDERDEFVDEMNRILNEQ